MKLKKTLILLALHLISLCSFSQQLQGGNILFDRMFFGSYFRITVELAAKLPFTSAKQFIKLNWNNGTPLDSLPFVGAYCTGKGATTLRYSDTRTLTTSVAHTVTVVDSFYVPNVTNIPNSSTKKMELRTEFDLSQAGNIITFPDFSVFCLYDSVPCCNNMGSYNPAVFDSDGDSLSYGISNPTNISGYIPPDVTINSETSMMLFNSSNSGLTHVRLKVDEWRKLSGNSPRFKISTTYREMMFKTFNAVGIKENSANLNGIELYPNPAKNEFTLVHSNSQYYTIQLVDVSGRILKTINATENKVNINISDLASGVYFVKTYFGKQQTLNKLILN
jgi:hypothetical protein